jgi:hypothetical protein
VTLLPDTARPLSARKTCVASGITQQGNIHDITIPSGTGTALPWNQRQRPDHRRLLRCRRIRTRLRRGTERMHRHPPHRKGLQRGRQSEPREQLIALHRLERLPLARQILKSNSVTSTASANQNAITAPENMISHAHAGAGHADHPAGSGITIPELNRSDSQPAGPMPG